MTKNEALKLALECVEAWDRGCDRDAYWRDIEECVTAIKQALAAPVQEPVGWMVYTQDGKSVYVTDNPTDIQEGQRALPLYTTPPAGQPAPEQYTAQEQALTRLQKWHAELELKVAAQTAPAPIKPIVDSDIDINQRLAFKLGWKSAEEAHGITKGQP
jgi:hypothetical protein